MNTRLYRYLVIYTPRCCLFCGRALHVKACKELIAFLDDDPNDTPTIIQEGDPDRP